MRAITTAERKAYPGRLAIITDWPTCDRRPVYIVRIRPDDYSLFPLAGPFATVAKARKARFNLEWQDVPSDADVTLEGQPGSRYYLVEGQGLPYWSSTDARDAQRYLDTLALRTARTKRSV